MTRETGLVLGFVGLGAVSQPLTEALLVDQMIAAGKRPLSFIAAHGGPWSTESSSFVLEFARGKGITTEISVASRRPRTVR